MDNTQHAEDCRWTIKQIKKTKEWYDFMGIKDCPICGAPVEVQDETTI